MVRIEYKGIKSNLKSHNFMLSNAKHQEYILQRHPPSE